MRRAPRYLSTNIRELVAGKIEIERYDIFFLDRRGRVIDHAKRKTSPIEMRQKRDALLSELRAVVAVWTRKDDSGRPISDVEIYNDDGSVTSHTLRAPQHGHGSEWITPPEPATTGHWLAVWGTREGGTDTKNT